MRVFQKQLCRTTIVQVDKKNTTIFFFSHRHKLRDGRKPSAQQSIEEKRGFIISKYERKEFVNRDSAPPHELLTQNPSEFARACASVDRGPPRNDERGGHQRARPAVQVRAHSNAAPAHGVQQRPQEVNLLDDFDGFASSGATNGTTTNHANHQSGLADDMFDFVSAPAPNGLGSPDFGPFAGASGAPGSSNSAEDDFFLGGGGGAATNSGFNGGFLPHAQTFPGGSSSAGPSQQANKLASFDSDLAGLYQSGGASRPAAGTSNAFSAFGGMGGAPGYGNGGGNGYNGMAGGGMGQMGYGGGGGNPTMGGFGGLHTQQPAGRQPNGFDAAFGGGNPFLSPQQHPMSVPQPNPFGSSQPFGGAPQGNGRIGGAGGPSSSGASGSNVARAGGPSVGMYTSSSASSNGPALNGRGSFGTGSGSLSKANKPATLEGIMSLFRTIDHSWKSAGQHSVCRA